MPKEYTLRITSCKDLSRVVNPRDLAKVAENPQIRVYLQRFRASTRDRRIRAKRAGDYTHYNLLGEAFGVSGCISPVGRDGTLHLHFERVFCRLKRAAAGETWHFSDELPHVQAVKVLVDGLGLSRSRMRSEPAPISLGAAPQTDLATIDIDKGLPATVMAEP